MHNGKTWKAQDTLAHKDPVPNVPVLLSTAILPDPAGTRGHLHPVSSMLPWAAAPHIHTEHKNLNVNSIESEFEIEESGWFLSLRK